MKIKRKVQKNLPQLIEWLLKSGYRNYTANSNMGNIVTLSRYGAIQFSLGTFFPEETFTVEVEEVVDEYTVFNYLLLTYKKDNDKIETHCYEDKCIKSVLSQSSRLMYVSEQLSITYFDDKGIPHLIWTHEKSLVE
ncbi:hypothetical protein [Staphylococcus saprophyticus]|uniref:hypothetical protein n=1 Tax=Staphylococcus saprophyticus TaxID=29385 RepID=UPI00065F7158|nr:hypothetical protein [Staphylococcus saprophyticus]AMG33637.1 hypothetical protein AL494_07690 [Staphylococcus saprophyticus]MDW3837908.1 hypothetical protein [Staphylococcus saprophyticus]MDW4061934.1 hypothetical protein [Staphylococcus saprophyticus]MDW4103999.1 hypothetical protein [Staphylococcus saprophyticus]MDW4205085.1 hypothetical protein [Staphylococcus saprophyticus]